MVSEALDDKRDFKMSSHSITKYSKEFYHLKVLFLAKQSANGTHGRLHGMEWSPLHTLLTVHYTWSKCKVISNIRKT